MSEWRPSWMASGWDQVILLAQAVEDAAGHARVGE